MEYVITFADVMAGVITLIVGVLSFLIKNWIKGIQSSNEEIKKEIKEDNEEIKKQIKENNEKISKRIDKLEEKTEADISNIKKELTDIKGDFATTFVLREDFFRSMNGVEDKMKSIDGKIDRTLTLLMNIGNKRE